MGHGQRLTALAGCLLLFLLSVGCGKTEIQVTEEGQDVFWPYQPHDAAPGGLDTGSDVKTPPADQRGPADQQSPDLSPEVTGTSDPGPPPEMCNGADDDLDGQTDEAGAIGCHIYCVDVDGDGTGGADCACLCSPSMPYVASILGDCNDLDAEVKPGGVEDCANPGDEDCDGVAGFAQCVSKQCGDDGCGGQCGECPPGTFCSQTFTCTNSCVPTCSGKLCGPDGCGGLCGQCGFDEECGPDGQCIELCSAGCQGKQCGPDGCGGECGECSAGLGCVDGACLPAAVIEVYPECPPGYLEGGRWRTGPWSSDAVPEGTGYSTGEIDKGWMVLCTADPQLVQVVVGVDHCGGAAPAPGCPQGMENRGAWHVGKVDCSQAEAAIAYPNETLISGWLLLCAAPDVDAFIAVEAEECGWAFPNAGCPSGATWAGQWHTDPSVCDKKAEGEATNGLVDSGFISLCLGD